MYATHDQWHEQAYEHSDSIISVEASADQSTDDVPAHVITASKDGTIYCWNIGGETNEDDRLTYVADHAFDEPLSKAKWLTQTCILVTTMDGNAYTLKIEKDSQGVECLSRPSLVYTTEHSVSIWDFTVMNMAQKLEVYIAEDSGKVT